MHPAPIIDPNHIDRLAYRTSSSSVEWMSSSVGRLDCVVVDRTNVPDVDRY